MSNKPALLPISVEVLSSKPGNDTSVVDRALPSGTKLYTRAPADSAVAWRDPSNIEPAQGCTYSRETAEKWPHLFSQPLYATPPLAVGAITEDMLDRMAQAFSAPSPMVDDELGNPVHQREILKARLRAAFEAIADNGSPPNKIQTDHRYVAGALAMREKIFRAISMSSRKTDLEIAAHVRVNVKPPTPAESVQWDSDAKALLAESNPEIPA